MDDFATSGIKRQALSAIIILLACFVVGVSFKGYLLYSANGKSW
jgi:hypothetical protein